MTRLGTPYLWVCRGHLRAAAAAVPGGPGGGDLGLVLGDDARALGLGGALALEQRGVEESPERLELGLGLGVLDQVGDLVAVHHGRVAVEVGGAGVRLAAVAALEGLRVPPQVVVDGRQRLQRKGEVRLTQSFEIRHTEVVKQSNKF